MRHSRINVSSLNCLMRFKCFGNKLRWGAEQSFSCWAHQITAHVAINAVASPHNENVKRSTIAKDPRGHFHNAFMSQNTINYPELGLTGGLIIKYEISLKNANFQFTNLKSKNDLTRQEIRKYRVICSIDNLIRLIYILKENNLQNINPICETNPPNTFQ